MIGCAVCCGLVRGSCSVDRQIDVGRVKAKGTRLQAFEVLQEGSKLIYQFKLWCLLEELQSG